MLLFYRYLFVLKPLNLPQLTLREWLELERGWLL
jgi:hypothetical protein